MTIKKLPGDCKMDLRLTQMDTIEMIFNVCFFKKI